MKTFGFLADRAKQFATSFFYDTCDFIVGKADILLIPRYLVYPTFFSWLLEAASERETGKDKLYATHTGSLSDLRKDSPMWNYFSKQKEVASKHKLEIERLLVLTEEDKDESGKRGIYQTLYELKSRDISLYLSSTKLLEEYIEKNKTEEFNWAIFERDGHFLLLMYKTIKSEYLTMVTMNQDEIRKKKELFSMIQKNKPGDLCFPVVFPDTFDDPIKALDDVLDKSRWDC